MEDYPNLTPEELSEIKKYRHALREFININKAKILSNGKTPDFPQQPEFININILY